MEVARACGRMETVGRRLTSWGAWRACVSEVMRERALDAPYASIEQLNRRAGFALRLFSVAG